MQNSKGVNGGICESGTREEGGDPLVGPTDVALDGPWGLNGKK